MAEVIDNRGQNRFEMALAVGMAFVAYRHAEGVIFLDHAEVPQALEGRGIGSALVKATLEAVRREGLQVIPRCPFIAAYIRRHPEFADLLASR
jgi:predicted GNAT family acetyltransferase